MEGGDIKVGGVGGIKELGILGEGSTGSGKGRVKVGATTKYCRLIILLVLLLTSFQPLLTIQLSPPVLS